VWSTRVKSTGRKKLVIAALWSEDVSCSARLHAMATAMTVRRHRRVGGVSPKHTTWHPPSRGRGAQPIKWLGMAESCA